MGAYMYCSGCEEPLPAPWDQDTQSLLFILFMEDNSVRCLHCGSMGYYDTTALLTVLADRIDNPQTRKEEK